MSSGSPLARVKEEFGGKDKLVDKLVGLVDAGEESKDDLRKRLLGAANSKLLRLHVVATKVKEQGGHDKLAAAAAASAGAESDARSKASTRAGRRMRGETIIRGRRAGAPAEGPGGRKVPQVLEIVGSFPARRGFFPSEKTFPSGVF